jgi:hypothetical protein
MIGLYYPIYTLGIFGDCHNPLWRKFYGIPIHQLVGKQSNHHREIPGKIAISPSGWWFQPTPLKNDGVRQLG